MSIQVIKSRCPENHNCPLMRVCPVNAITQKGYNAPEIDKNLCIDCGKCVKYCPTGAVQNI